MDDDGYVIYYVSGDKTIIDDLKNEIITMTYGSGTKGEKNLLYGTDYEADYYYSFTVEEDGSITNRTKVDSANRAGIYSLVVKGIGDYTGSSEMMFKLKENETPGSETPDTNKITHDIGKNNGTPSSSSQTPSSPSQEPSSVTTPASSTATPESTAYTVVDTAATGTHNVQWMRIVGITAAAAMCIVFAKSKKA